MKKRILAVFLLSVMVFSMIPFSAQAAGANPFEDVTETDYYYEPVMWALSEGVTTGTTATKFSPAATCTRGQVVTFLWRALGKPEPASTENPFTDVKESDYYFKPILWAVEQGITNGTSAKQFSPNVTCTNAHILTFIWRAVGSPDKRSEGEWYADAVNWATKSDMIVSYETFKPSADCPRADVVTYLYKYATASSASSTELKLYVSPNGNNATADGSVAKPFSTIEAARDYIRTLDKTGLTGITVKLAAGEYTVKDTIKFTAKDSGTADCPITYQGADGATLIGGIKLTAADFTQAKGGLTEYFPEEVRDSIVMVDLTKKGITAATVQKAMEDHGYLDAIPFLSVDGERQILAQYPNDWLHVEHTVTHSEDGTTDTAKDHETLQTVEYGDEYAAEVQSWSEVLPVFVRARLYKLWCPGDTLVAKIYKDCDKVDILFAGDHEPADGTVMYFYNVPEALDIPGEYIIDKNAVLYYYPTESFADATMTIPYANGIINTEKTNFITFDNLTLTSSYDYGFETNGNYTTISNCTVSSIRGDAIVAEGNNLLIEGNTVYDIGSDGIDVVSGDMELIKGGTALVSNNDVSAFSVTDAYGYGIDVKGVDITVSHNDVHDANFKGIHTRNSVNVTIEYNDVWNMMLLSDDVGALSADGTENANIIFRYNYVHDIGPVGEPANIKAYNPDYSYYGCAAFYYDNGCSYIQTYGNVVKGCDNGYLSNGGRSNTCTNNIFADCRMWYVTFSQFMYAGKLNSDGKITGSEKMEEFVTSAAWKKVNAEPSTLIWDSAKVTDQKDSRIWCAPANNVCRDNVILYNKGVRDFTNWGIRPYNIEEYVKQFSAKGIVMQGEDVAASTIYSYSSKRNDIDIEEKVAEYAEITGLTLEMFHSIGKIKK